MSGLVFICLMAAVVIAVVLPILFTAGMLILRKLKVLQLLKGLFIGIVVNSFFLPFVFSAMLLFFQVKEVVSWKMFLCFIPYSLVTLAMLYFFCIKAMRLMEEPENCFSMMLGFAYIPMYSFSQTAFDNLIIGDHIRIGNLEYIYKLGYENAESVIATFDVMHISYFLAVGFQAIAILFIQLLIIQLICVYAENRGTSYLCLSFLMIFIQQVSMYSSAVLTSWSLLLMVLCMIALSTALAQRLKKEGFIGT